MKLQQLAGIAGSLIALVFIILAINNLGMVAVILFLFYAGLAFQDAIKGRIPLMAFVPIILLPLYYLETFLAVYVPVFGVLLIIWIGVRILQKKIMFLDSQKPYFGFGDVLGLPLALALALVYVPFWGLPIFAGALALLMPLFLRRQQRRFLPWLALPLATVFILGVFL